MKSRSLFKRSRWIAIAGGFALACVLALLTLLISGQPSLADQPKPDDVCERLGLETACELPEPVQVINTMDGGGGHNWCGWDYCPPQEWACDDIWTTGQYEQDWSAYYETFQYQQALGVQMHSICLPYSDPACWPDVPFMPGPGQLIHIREFHGSWWEELSESQLQELQDFAERGGTVLWENEHERFTPSGYANWVHEQMGVSYRLDPSVPFVPSIHLVEPWDYGPWIHIQPYYDTTMTGAVALATGRYVGNQHARGLYTNLEGDSVVIVEESKGDGRVRANGDSNNLEGDGWWYYSHGSSDHLRFWAVAFSCVDQQGGQIPQPPVTPTVMLTAEPQEYCAESRTPITFTLGVTNPSSVPIEFDSRTPVGGDWWDREFYPPSFSSGTEIYDTYCDGWGCRYWWRGVISPSQAVSLTIPTFANDLVGNHLAASTAVTVGQVTVTRTVEIATLECPAEADLAIEQWPTESCVQLGQSTWFTATVTNAGPDVATGLVMTNTFPVSQTGVLVESSHGWCDNPSPDAPEVVCQIDTLGLPPNDVVLHVKMTPLAIGMITNTLEVSANEVDPNLENNIALASTRVAADCAQQMKPIYLPLVMRNHPPPGCETLPYQVTEAIWPPIPVDEVPNPFYTVEFCLNVQEGQEVWLSGARDSLEQHVVDDVFMMYVDDELLPEIDYSKSGSPTPKDAIDLSEYFTPGVHQVRVELWDRYLSVVSSSELWLVAQEVVGGEVVCEVEWPYAGFSLTRAEVYNTEDPDQYTVQMTTVITVSQPITFYQAQEVNGITPWGPNAVLPITATWQSGTPGGWNAGVVETWPGADRWIVKHEWLVNEPGVYTFDSEWRIWYEEGRYPRNSFHFNTGSAVQCPLATPTLHRRNEEY